MRIDELEELIESDPAEAEAAIDEMVSRTDIGGLTQAASAQSVRLSSRAIEGLADVGTAEAASALVELLEQAQVQRVFWGTEQEREHENRQSQLVQAVARTRGVTPPTVRSPEDVAEFIEESRRG
jgi:hypothetical protein